MFVTRLSFFPCRLAHSPRGFDGRVLIAVTFSFTFFEEERHPNTFSSSVGTADSATFPVNSTATLPISGSMSYLRGNEGHIDGVKNIHVLERSINFVFSELNQIAKFHLLG
jgi:hypothetical protein